MPRDSPVETPGEFRHHCLGIDALRQHVAMIAIGGDLLIAFLGHAHQADHNGFLANIQMAKATDQAHAVQLARSLLEAADQEHVVIEFFEGFRIAFGCVGHERLGCRFWFLKSRSRFSQARTLFGKANARLGEQRSEIPKMLRKRKT